MFEELLISCSTPGLNVRSRMHEEPVTAWSERLMLVILLALLTVVVDFCESGVDYGWFGI